MPFTRPALPTTAPTNTGYRLLPLAIAALGLLVLPGCRAFSRPDCNKPQFYEQAQNLQGLRIPVGLDPLNTRSAMKIPDLREPEAPRSVNDACLDEPPKFSNARLLPLVRDKATLKAEKKAAAEAEKKAKADKKAADKAAKAAKKAAGAQARKGGTAAPAPDAAR